MNRPPTEYEAAAAAHKPRFNKKVLIEPVIIATMILAYLIGMGLMQQRDDQISQASSAKTNQARGQK
jgi:hypothetical protein